MAPDPPPTPQAARGRLDRLKWQREAHAKKLAEAEDRLGELDAYLAISDGVSGALEALNERLFRQVLGVVEEKLTVALREVLEQPLTLRAEVDFKRGGATVEFWSERDGQKEDIYRGQGGSVANVLSVGLRMFALATLPEAEHRRFLVLDEQDCWLRPDLVPKLVKIVHDAGRALGFQVLMISHHSPAAFEQYADRVYALRPTADGGLAVDRVGAPPDVAD